MNWAQKAITGIFLSAALLAPTIASATPIRVYEQASPTQQAEILKDSYKTAVANTISSLRATHFKNGKEKTPERIERDKVRADIIERIAPHLTDKQEIALTSLIDQFAQAQPDTELEDVIASFLLTEANNQINDGPSGNITASLHNN